MGDNCGNWMPKPHFDWQSSNPSFFGAPLDAGKQNSISAAMNSGSNVATRNETVPAAYASSMSPHLQLGGNSNAPHGWFYCLPRFRQGFTPVPNLTAEEKQKLPSDQWKSFREEITSDRESGFPQKRFLVIDQTGDQTTLIYSWRYWSPVEFHASWDSKLHGPNYLNGNNEPSSLRRDLNLNHVVGPNQGTDDTESEMHEDTEEINALLFSDSDGYSTEDDEITSTGHSPSTMITHDHDNNQEPARETAEEVASSLGKTKKRKLFDEAYDDIQIMDTASSLNPNRLSYSGDDAESRCSSGSNSRVLGKPGSLSGNKKTRKEKMQDVLNILQSIIPSGKDKNPVELLDEAILSLKSLKLKAIALGLNAF